LVDKAPETMTAVCSENNYGAGCGALFLMLLERRPGFATTPSAEILFGPVEIPSRPRQRRWWRTIRCLRCPSIGGSFVLLPHYFRGDLYTAYELIERRFGLGLRSLTSGLFLLTRAAAEGVRVYAVSIVVAIALGTGEVASIAIITLLTLIYTFEGGLAAVIWTDVVQTGIYVTGTLLGIATIVHYVPGRWAHIHQIAAASGRLRVFDF